MKLTINYDFFNAIRDVNKPVGTFKVIRNGPFYKQLFKWSFFLALGASFLMKDLAPMVLPGGVTLFSAYRRASDYKTTNKDPYAERSAKRLYDMVSQFEKVNVATNYDLLRKSSMTKRRYKIVINEDNLPRLLESKHIFVRTDSYGTISSVPVLQEHVVGSKQYVLSINKW